MTLCIAAPCGGAASSNVVLAFDWRVETEVASSETTIKWMPLSRHWSAMISGPLMQCKELMATYSEFLTTQQDALTNDNACEMLSRPLKRIRHKLADELVHARLAISFEEFKQRGKEALTTDVRRSVLNEIMGQWVESEFILIGPSFNPQGLTVYKTHNVSVGRCADFAAVGSGAPQAEAVLYERQQNIFHDVNTTLYNVYEAKRYGEKAPGVGKKTSMAIISHDPEAYTYAVVTDAGFKVLSRYYRRFGPRPTSGITIPSECLLKHPRKAFLRQPN
jgi:hypothetical protein